MFCVLCFRNFERGQDETACWVRCTTCSTSGSPRVSTDFTLSLSQRSSQAGTRPKAYVPAEHSHLTSKCYATTHQHAWNQKHNSHGRVQPSTAGEKCGWSMSDAKAWHKAPVLKIKRTRLRDSSLFRLLQLIGCVCHALQLRRRRRVTFDSVERARYAARPRVAACSKSRGATLRDSD